MADSVVVTDLVGRERPVVRFWEDGGYDCPFCGYPTTADCAGSGWVRQVEGRHCCNPGCTANPHLDPVKVRAGFEESERRRERQEAEDAERRARHEQFMAAMDANRQADRQRWAEVAAEAKNRGACLECLSRSRWRSEPRYIRHRSGCPRLSNLLTGFPQSRC